MKTWYCHVFNTSVVGNVVGGLTPPSSERSPSLPAFDKARLLVHGRVRIECLGSQVILLGSPPYNVLQRDVRESFYWEDALICAAHRSRFEWSVEEGTGVMRFRGWGGMVRCRSLVYDVEQDE